MRYNKIFLYLVMPLLVEACTQDEEEQPLFFGQPMDLCLNIDSRAFTRSMDTPTGSVFVQSNLSTVTKRYTYDGGKFVSDNPLMWLASNMTINGYYYQINGATGEMTFLYTVDNDDNHLQTSFCAGQVSVTYPSDVKLELRQQLAMIEVTVKADDGTGTVQSHPLFGGDLLYMTGTFDPTTFDAKGYATGGTGGTGWIPSTNTDKKTIAMKTKSSSNGEYTYYAVILPQRITDTSTPIFTVDVGPNAQTVMTTVKYKLKSATTFKAGYTYQLRVDNVTNTLYVDSGVQVEDFENFDSSRRSITDCSTGSWTSGA